MDAITLSAKQLKPGDVINGLRIIAITPYVDFMAKCGAVSIELEDGAFKKYTDATMLLVQRNDA